jgi:ADP-ribosylglycohydrolase
MNHSAYDIMLPAVAGDALGTPFEGMGRGHIESCFGSLSGFADPEPGLRGRMERWKKPGLYSSISQFMLLLAISCCRRGPCAEAFAHCMSSSRALAESGYGIFRYPDAAESSFIAACTEQHQAAAQSSSPSTRIIAALAPLSLRDNAPPEMLADTVSFLRLFTADRQTIAAGLLYVFLLGELITGASAGTDPVGEASRLSAQLQTMVSSEYPALVFASGVSPDALASELRVLAGLLSLIRAADSIRTAEDIICSHLNKTLKNQITRATINIPAALVPFAVSFSALHGDDDDILYRAAAEGGSSSSFTAIVGSLSASRRGMEAVPDGLLQGLVNRKRIASIVDSLVDGSPAPALAEEFIRSEASLTAKAEEEHHARIKHIKKKPDKKVPSRTDRERALARHVVESWTKLDKAKWKKERKQREQNGES